MPRHKQFDEEKFCENKLNETLSVKLPLLCAFKAVK